MSPRETIEQPLGTRSCPVTGEELARSEPLYPAEGQADGKTDGPPLPGAARLRLCQNSLGTGRSLSVWKPNCGGITARRTPPSRSPFTACGCRAQKPGTRRQGSRAQARARRVMRRLVRWFAGLAAAGSPRCDDDRGSEQRTEGAQGERRAGARLAESADDRWVAHGEHERLSFACGVARLRKQRGAAGTQAPSLSSQSNQFQPPCVALREAHSGETGR